MVSRTILLDGDIICWQVATGNEVEIKWDENLWTLHSNEEECVRHLKDYVDRIMENLKGDKLIIALSDAKNFRKEVYKPYKENRKDMRKPLAFKGVKDFMQKNYDVVIKPNLEADDVLGILSTADNKRIPGKKIIVSIDKDFEQIPGYLHNPNKDISLDKNKKMVYNIRKVTRKSADFNFFFQTLIGDKVDNYPGVTGVGEVTAHKILDGVKTSEMWDKVVYEFVKKGLTEDDALQQARCARILRAEDYDFKKNEVKLWSP